MLYLVLTLLASSRFVVSDDCNEFYTDSGVNNVQYDNPTETHSNLTVGECTKICMKLQKTDQCLSYGYQTITKECYIYNQFASVGDETKPSEGLVFFWTYSRPCPLDKGYELIGSDGSCVKFYNLELNGWEAKEHCRREGGHLMIMNTEAKRQYLISKYTSYKEYVYVGGTDVHEEGNWLWFDGRKIDKFWMEGEPNNFGHEYGEGEECLQLRHDLSGDKKFDSVLNDSGCSSRHKLACEVPQPKQRFNY
ncbi:hypothetical protein LOTGIDRAFT_228706 [Lottia gigantea]|uniref:C-type lectin domain-containing protein n=1 Tax=Lottia gigantea TaxID=225164 RepID=V4A7Y1_LOTGI|nr:hypothetical protein LOTGIDRAFT_228706 [Lottia gigantea]ESO91155.1 hypothetical protein LOTGIDRAFT_228706 [Lottia gigantea]